MTLEELKKIAMCYAHDELKDNCSPIEAVVAGAFMSGIDYIQHNPAWISVEEELPIDYEPVLAVVGGNHFAFVGICLNKTTWYCEIQNKVTEIIGITHWMHLPQPPKKGAEEAVRWADALIDELKK